MLLHCAHSFDVDVTHADHLTTKEFVALIALSSYVFMNYSCIDVHSCRLNYVVLKFDNTVLCARYLAIIRA